MKNIFFLSAFVISIFPIFAKADDASSGCGMGWQVAKDQSLVSSSIRSTVNATFLNTVAMTFGTSGCAKHKIVMKEKAALHFAEANYHNLMMEMAMGRGEYVESFAAILGCKDSRRLNAVVQKNFNQIFPSVLATPGEMLTRTRQIISTDPALAADCSQVI